VGEMKEIERERLEAEKDRKEIEQERWNLEEEKNKISLRMKEANLKLQRVKNKEERLQERIKEIDRNRSAIEDPKKEREKPLERPKRKKPEEAPAEIPEKGFGDLNEEDLIRKAQERLEKIRQDREDGMGRTWPAPKIEAEPPEEKREEIRPETKVFLDESSENFQPVSVSKKPSEGKIKVEEMRVQEEEARKKFLERVEGKEGATLFEEEYGEKIEPPSVILKTLPRKSSSYDKLFVRILVLVLFFVIVIGGVFLSYLFIKKKTSPPEGTPKTETPAEEKPPVVPEEPAIFPSPFEIVETEPLQVFEDNNEIPALLEKFFNLNLASNKFTRVSFLNIKTNRYVGLKEFLDALQIKTPENFYQKLADNEVFFVWSQPQGKRFGFLVEIKENENESMGNMLRLWEPEMEANFEVLYKMMNKTQPALVPYFTELSHQGVSYRCQAFTKLDLGICHLVIDRYVVFTSSSVSMEKIIEELAIKR